MNARQLIALAKEKLNSSDIAQRMAKGTFWSLSGSVIGRAIMLLAGILTARILGKTGYGEFGMLRTVVGMFVVFGIAGLGTTAMKFISEYRSKDKERIASIYASILKIGLALAVIVSIVFYCFTDFFTSVRLNSPHLLFALRCSVVLLFFSVLEGVQSGILIGFENFKGVAIVNFLSAIFKSCLSVLGAYYYGIEGALLGLGLGFFTQCVCYHIFIRQSFKALGLDDALSSGKAEDIKLLLSFGIPMAMASMLSFPCFWYIKDVLVNNAGYDAVAIYEVGDQWKQIILFIPITVGQIVLPILSSILHKGSGNFWKVLKLNIYINATISFCIALFATLFSSYIMGLYGKGFDDTWTLSLMAFSTVLTSITHIQGLSIAARNKIWLHFSFMLSFAITLVACSIYFVKVLHLGAIGLALATIIAYGLQALVQHIYLYKTVVLSAKEEQCLEAEGQKMKIAHCIFSFNTGGAELLIIDIINEQIKTADISLIIINDSYEKELLEQLDPRVKVILLNRKLGSRSLLPIIKLNKLLLRKKLDIIHLHNASIYQLLLYLFRSKLVITLHDIGIDISFIKRVKAIVAVSKSVQEDIKGRTGREIIFINNGIKISSFINQEKAHNKKDPFTIVQIARLEYLKKGQDTLIKALSLLQIRGYSNIYLDFIGYGKDDDYLKALAKDEDLADKVRFLGKKDRDYIYKHLKDYDLMCHPSRYEGFGLVVAEAMLSKVPVLVSNNDGPKDIIKYGAYGYLCQPDSIESCARQIKGIYEHYDEALALAEKAYSYAKEHYTTERMVQEYFDVYNQ